MRRTAVAAVAAIVLAAWPASAPASASPLPGRPKLPTAAISIVPRWTYRAGGKLAVITRCSRPDLRVVSSKMLRHPVNMPRRGNLLIRVTGATKPGRYTIAVWCVTRRGQVDAMDVKWVTIRARPKGGRMPRLPRHFRPRVTVSTWAPARHKNRHRRRRH